VLVVVAGHWGPFVLLRMGDLSGPLMHWTIPLFHLGTPGFAMMFGIGLAFFNLNMVLHRGDRFRANMRSNLMIVGGAVAALAVMRGTARTLVEPGTINPSNLFYGVLAAYLILVAISGGLLRLIAHRQHPILSSLILALVSLTLASTSNALWGRADTSGVVDLARLLLVTKYGFAQMLGYVSIGIAIGLWIEQSHDSEELPAQATLAGVALILGSVLLTVALGLEAKWFGSAGIHMIVAYCGVVLLLFATMLTSIRRGYADGILKIPLRILLMIGILAFVIYVGHEAVMAVVEILTASRVPYLWAVIIPVATFMLGCTFGARRLYKLYFG
jgi:hypothetical protein